MALRVALVMVALAGVVGGCSGADGGGVEEAAPTEEELPDEADSERDVGPMADPAVWEEVAPGGDCQCSDGSEYVFWVRKADPAKVVLYLQDGGACFSVETCTPDNELYNRTVTEGPAQEDGMYDLADERNPFADHSIVFAPYCSGDVFLGNATTEYAPDLTIQHKGYANGTAALDHLAATFPAATDVVVVGESAGSVAAPLYAGLAADRLPDARITALADGSGSYPDLPDLNRRLADAWGIESVIPDWSTWGMPGLFVRSGRQHPEITFARHDFAYDENQHIWYRHIGVEVGDLRERIDANETAIEAAGVDLLSYIEPGDGHTALSERELFATEVNGRPLVDWVTKLIAGEPVDDVHCTECTG